MSIGKLTERVDIMAMSYVADGMGGNMRTFVKLFSVWAEIVGDHVNSVANVAGSRHVESDQTFKVRANEAISIDGYIKYEGQYYKMLKIRELEGTSGYMMIDAKAQDDVA